jgi:DnaK suppressor protein
VRYKQTGAGHQKPTDLKRFKAILLAKQREILANVISMENEALRKLNTVRSSLPYHWADLGTDSYELENTLGLVGSERNILAEIEEALTRIQNGTYGICAAGGEFIPRARLRAIPWARYCVRCASLNERGLLHRESDLDVYGCQRVWSEYVTENGE